MKLEYWRLSHDIVPFDVASSRRDKLRGAAEKGLQFCSWRYPTQIYPVISFVRYQRAVYYELRSVSSTEGLEQATYDTNGISVANY